MVCVFEFRRRRPSCKLDYLEDQLVRQGSEQRNGGRGGCDRFPLLGLRPISLLSLPLLRVDQLLKLLVCHLLGEHRDEQLGWRLLDRPAEDAATIAVIGGGGSGRHPFGPRKWVVELTVRLAKESQMLN